MSEFEVKLVQIEIEDHPNADALELAVVGGFRAVVKKDRFKSGDWVAYVPEGAMLPDWLMKQEAFWDFEKDRGMLSGGTRNRIKPCKLRGALSEGIVIRPNQIVSDDPSRVCFHRNVPEYNNDPDWYKTEFAGSPAEYDEELCLDHVEQYIWVDADTNLVDFFEIKKYEPKLPGSMTGAGNIPRPQGEHRLFTVKFDIENIKKYNRVMEDGEPIVLTEKIHGTFTQIGFDPEHELDIVTSKGLGGRGFIFDISEENKDNLYVKTATAMDDNDESLLEKVRFMAKAEGKPVYFLGEIFGMGVQDLQYGMSAPTFRLFDIFIGKPNEGSYVDFSELTKIAETLNIPMVPVLYEGGYSLDVVKEHTDGKESVSGNSANIREGVVIKSTTGRTDARLGRIILKSVSEKYLTRRNGSELQ